MNEIPDSSRIANLPLERSRDGDVILIDWVQAHHQMDLPELVYRTDKLISMMAESATTRPMRQALEVFVSISKLSKALRRHYQVLCKLSLSHIDGPDGVMYKDKFMFMHTFLQSCLIICEIAHAHLLQQRFFHPGGKRSAMELFTIASGLQKIRKYLYKHLEFTTYFLTAVQNTTNEQDDSYKLVSILTRYDEGSTLTMPWRELRTFKWEMLGKIRNNGDWACTTLGAYRPLVMMPVLEQRLSEQLQFFFGHIRPFYVLAGGTGGNPFLKWPEISFQDFPDMLQVPGGASRVAQNSTTQSQQVLLARARGSDIHTTQRSLQQARSMVVAVELRDPVYSRGEGSTTQVAYLASLERDLSHAGHGAPSIGNHPQNVTMIQPQDWTAYANSLPSDVAFGQPHMSTELSPLNTRVAENLDAHDVGRFTRAANSRSRALTSAGDGRIAIPEIYPRGGDASVSTYGSTLVGSSTTVNLPASADGQSVINYPSMF